MSDTANTPNLERIRRWVDALRSGDYKQIRGALCADGGYCCLGVACDIHAKETGGDWEPSNYNRHIWAYDGAIGMLPDEVFCWFGLSSNNPDDAGRLVSLNDGGYSFQQIADVIEETYLSDSEATQE